MRRIIFSLFLLSLVLLMGSTVFAGDGNSGAAVSIRMAITPLQGEVGTSISVSGTGANPALDVIVALAPQADSSAGALASVTAKPAADGVFSATLTVPANTADGRYAVRVEQLDSAGKLQQYSWNAFTVGAGGGDNLLPVTGTVPGTPLTITAALALLLTAGMMLRGLYGVLSSKKS